jgi:sugar phosphate permease
VFLVVVAGFLLLGPCPYLAGTMRINFGSMRGSATAAGIIDDVGYLSGWLSGDTVARITVYFGWKDAFLSLAGVAVLTALVAVMLAWHRQMRAPGGGNF